MTTAITETIIERRVTIVIDGAGAVQSARTDGTIALMRDTTRVGTRPVSRALSSEDLVAALPDKGSLLAQIAALTAERDAAVAAQTTAEQTLAAVTAERDDARTSREAAEVQLAAMHSGSTVTINGVPQMVTNYQARAALLAAGLFDQVNTAVHAQGVSTPAYQAWEYANNVYRNSAFIAQLSSALGLTAQQIDALFIAAAQIDS